MSAGRKTIILFLAGLLLAGFFWPAPQAEANLFTDWWQSIKERFKETTLLAEPAEPAVDVSVAADEPTAPPAAATSEPERSLYQPVIDYENAVTSAVEQAEAAVVSIIVTRDLVVIERCPVDPFANLPPEVRQFFDWPEGESQPCGQEVRRQEVGGGSGFIVTSDGLIITNKHVVEDEEASYTVLTNDGRRLPAKVLAKDPVLDLAVVKVAATGLKTVKLGNSDTVKLGQTAIAIGNALGEFRNTVSVGVISGLSRNITAQGSGGVERIEGVLQTDAAINPGNSGGPLLNLRGEVIGINTAVASGAQSIGFAIPINQAKRSIESVKQSGKIITPYLGVRYVLVDEVEARRRGLKVDYGALIAAGREGAVPVVAGSPADKVGLREGDVILEIDGERINADKSLAYLIQKHKAGDWVEIKIWRNDKEFVMRAQLAGRES